VVLLPVLYMILMIIRHLLFLNSEDKNNCQETADFFLDLEGASVNNACDHIEHITTAALAPTHTGRSGCFWSWWGDWICSHYKTCVKCGAELEYPVPCPVKPQPGSELYLG
jgi:hypothetical protein